MKLFVEESRKRVIRSLKEKFHNTTDSDEPSAAFHDIPVPFDGTWMLRGFRSHIGASFVIECETGMVIDFIVLSNNCTLCEKEKKILLPEAFTHWKVSHAVFCKQNFEGKSGAMETGGAVRLWSRSQEYGLRYTSFIGDADSSVFNVVCALNNGR